MNQFTPHALIVVGLLGLIAGMPEPIALGLMLGGHLILPVAAARAPKEQRLRAALRGPILVIAIEAAVLAVAWLLLLRGNPEDTWLSLYLVLIASAALVLYAIYCAIAFAIVARD